jgi:hypothetical protein
MYRAAGIASFVALLLVFVAAAEAGEYFHSPTPGHSGALALVALSVAILAGVVTYIASQLHEERKERLRAMNDA